MFGMNSITGKAYFRDAPENTLTVTSRFFTLQGEGPYRGMPAYFVRLAKCNLNCHFCFVPSTKILMGDGSHKSIRDVKLGDLVQSWNGKEFEPKPVTRLYQSISDQLVKIKTETGEVTWCTPDHPFLVGSGQWVPAKNLNSNSILVDSDQNIVTVRSVETYKIDSVEVSDAMGAFDGVVYNLEVQDNHTYVANNLVVHNCDTYFDSGEVQSFDKIFSDANTEIEQFFLKRGLAVPSWAQPGPDRKIVLVMSGGEPTLQSNLSAFLVQAQDHFFQSQIESNGTVPIDLPRSTTFVVSPKCLEKKVGDEVHAVRYLEPKQEMLARADCLKFVMCAPEIKQFAAYSEVPDWAHEWSRNTGKPVFVSPMNMYLREPQRAREMRAQKQLDEITIAERSQIDETISFWEKGLLDMELNQRNHEFTAEYAMKHGFILNLQIHLYASLP
jgi:7-carboxy-7-deazaguanine synthase